MKLEWLKQGESVDQPVLTFSFNDLNKLIEGSPAVGFIRPGGTSEYTHTLAVIGLSEDEIAKALAGYVEGGRKKFVKGNADEGTLRDVYPIFNDPALSFRAGLTVHSARGTWSSLPHEFEREEILTPRPMPFYEQFAYVTDPPGGWGIQVRIGHHFQEFAESRWDGHKFESAIEVIRDRDILDIPLGSHPVTGGPGMKLCYFWAYWSDPATPWVAAMREKFK